MNKNTKEEYFLGLDIGTASVGWACVDNEYKLLKKNNKNTWGIRLFNNAKTNLDRRTQRSSRRRLEHRKMRQQWLKEVLESEIKKIDPEFFNRLTLSQFHLDSKTKETYLKLDLTKSNKNSLFNDPNYQDKDYFTQFPTIWHLRKYLSDGNTKNVDIRHYFLAINHILKHRGHFLFESGGFNFEEEFSPQTEPVRELAQVLTQEKYNQHYENKDIEDKLKKQLSKDNDLEEDNEKLTNSHQLLRFIFGGKKGEIELSKFEENFNSLQSQLDNEVFAVLEDLYKFYNFLEAKYLLGDANSLEDYYLKKYQQNRHQQLREKAFPRQLNEESLEKILENAPLSNEQKNKIRQIFEFRIDYFIGPLNDKSPHAWIKRISYEKITPWNLDKVVDIPATLEAFYKTLINKCNFLPSEDVLPKESLLNQEYLVLEQINNMKIDGTRIDQETKNLIYQAFKENNQTKSSLKKLLKENNVEGELKLPTESRKGGVEKEVKLHQLSSLHYFKKNCGENFNQVEAEDIIRKRTMQIDVKGYEDFTPKNWSRYSAKFLNGIKNAEEETIINCLENTSQNIMEILSQFQCAIDQENKETLKKNPYQILEERWFNPVAKRPIIQALKIIKELKHTLGVPKEIFLESTRDLDIEGKNKGKETITKAKQLIDLGLYKGSEFDSISDRKFLWLMQDKKCIYCEKHISLELGEVEHIIPKSKKFEDSLRTNLAFSCHDCNNDKKEIYPIQLPISSRTRDWWLELLQKNRISKEKYNRLTSQQQIDILGFLPGQLVATGMIGIALMTILKLKYPDIKINFIKPGLSKILRKRYSFKDKNDKQIEVKPEFPKSREANNFHHAQDAYLAIVSGRVYNYISGKYQSIGDTFFNNFSLSKLFWPESGERGNYEKVWNKSSFNNMVKTMKLNQSKDYNVTYQKQLSNEGALFDETVYRAVNYKEANQELITKLKKELKASDDKDEKDRINEKIRTMKTNAEIPRKKGLDPKIYGGFSSKKMAGIVYQDGEFKNVPNLNLANSKNVLPIFSNAIVNGSKILLKTSDEGKKLKFKSNYNLSFSFKQQTLLNRLNKLFETKGWKDKPELLKKFNNDELVKLLKVIDDQLPKLVITKTKVNEKYSNDLILLLEGLNNRLKNLYTESKIEVKNIKMDGKKDKEKKVDFLSKYINISEIDLVKIKHQSITGLWEK